MGWNKEGSTIIADYLGQLVYGVVLESRVKYGGKVQHTLNLDVPVQLPWQSEPTTRVLVDEDHVVSEFGELV